MWCQLLEEEGLGGGEARRGSCRAQREEMWVLPEAGAGGRSHGAAGDARGYSWTYSQHRVQPHTGCWSFPVPGLGMDREEPEGSGLPGLQLLDPPCGCMCCRANRGPTKSRPCGQHASSSAGPLGAVRWAFPPLL